MLFERNPKIAFLYAVTNEHRACDGASAIVGVAQPFGFCPHRSASMRLSAIGPSELTRRLAPCTELSSEDQELIHDVVRRFVRTPLFVARYFDVHARSGEPTLQAAFDTRDMSGASLHEKIDAFLKFIAKRCSSHERTEYLDALNRMQPGIRGKTRRDKDDDLSLMKGTKVMPNIRLANGLVKQETRQRLMLAFNTPFFPEVLVASSVLAEGVDLHLSWSRAATSAARLSSPATRVSVPGARCSATP